MVFFNQIKKFFYFLLLSYASLLFVNCSAQEPLRSWKTSVESIEKIDKNTYYTDGLTKIKGTDQRTDTVARSGKFSAVFNKKNQYGFGINISSIKLGDLFNASVWFKGNTGDINLVSTGKGAFRSSAVTEEEHDGWKKLKIEVLITLPIEKVNFHIKSNTDSVVFVDDFKIYKFRNSPSPNLTNKQNLDFIKLDIPDKSLTKIKSKRTKALEKGILISSKKDWVKASLNGEECKIRLKGDWTDHLAYYKWSYRIKYKNQPEKSFSITNPISRGYSQEWVNQQFMASQNLMTTGFDFKFLKVNGVNYGVYGSENHFSDGIIQKYNLNPSGHILKFDEGQLWEIRLKNKKHDKPESNVFMAADVQSYNKNRVNKNAIQLKEFIELGGLMDQLKYGDFVADSVFDITYQAKFLAMVDLFSSYHGLIWHNVRFYADPQTKKLQQIGFDLNTPHGVKISTPALFQKNYGDFLYKPLFSSENFKKLYIENLIAFTSETFIENMFLKLKPQLDKYEDALFEEYDSTLIQNQYIRERAAYLRNALRELDTNKYFKAKSNTYRPTIAPEEYKPFKNISVKAHTQTTSKKNKNVLIRNYYNKDVEIVGWINPKPNNLQLLETAYTLKKYTKNRTIPSNYTMEIPKEVKHLIYRVSGFDEDFKIKINKMPYPKSWVE